MTKLQDEEKVPLQDEEKVPFRKHLLKPFKTDLSNVFRSVYDELLKLAKSIYGQTVKVLKYSPIVTYFWLWSYKTGLRHTLKATSLGIISLSGVVLVLEVIMEWTGGKRLHELMVRIGTQSLAIGLPRFVNPHNVFRILFISAIAYLVWHHVTETWKVGYEYKFVKQVNLFMRSRLSNNNEQALIQNALPKFLLIFKDSRIVRCSVFRPDGEVLSIPTSHILPMTTDTSYGVRLKKGEGVAGLVFEDSKTLYVPRLFFPFAKRWSWTPSLFFPHAVRFDFHEAEDGFEMVNDRLRPKVFKKTVDNPPYRSTLSVPIVSSTNGMSFGVLNFDFSKNDPLDRSEIAMASILGVLLADELSRLKPALA
jgi:hypothetical protein